MKQKLLFYVLPMLCLGVLYSFICKEDTSRVCIQEPQKERVIDFVNSAVAHMENVGAEVAFMDFNAPDPSPEFVEKELYVFVLDIKDIANQNIIMIAHGADETLIGENVYNLQGKKGKYMVRDIVSVVGNSDQKGWSTYYWINPSNKEIREKHSYVVKTENYIVGTGFYDE